MRFVTTIFVRTIVCSSIFLAVGCGPSSELPKVAPVNGTVTYNGEPVPNANISFTPEDTKIGHAAMGTTNSSGKFQLTTFNTNDGAIPGKYKVAIIAQTNPLEGVAPGRADVQLQLGQGQNVPGVKKLEKAKALIPEKYFKDETSGLVYTVESDGSDINIVLEGEISESD